MKRILVRTLAISLLISISFLFSSGRASALEQKVCPAKKFVSGQTVTPTNEVVARYGSQHGSPGRFSLESGMGVVLTGDPVCENGSWWWSVSNGTWEGWIPEDGAHSLTENDPFNTMNGPNQPKKDQKTSTSSTAGSARTCAQVTTPNLPAGTRVIQVLAQCLNLRSSPEIKQGNIVGTARSGSRFRLAFDPSTNWFMITVPGLGDVFVARGVGDTLSRLLQK